MASRINFGGLEGAIDDDGVIRYGGLVGQLEGDLEDGTFVLGGLLGRIVAGTVYYGGLIGTLEDGVLRFGGMVGLVESDGPPPPAFDPYFANVQLLLHMDGADAGTTFTEVKGNAMTRSGAVTSTTDPKFGTAACHLPALSNYLRPTTYVAGFEAAAGDFTVEFWLKVPTPASASVNFCFIRGSSDATSPWIFSFNGGSLRFRTTGAGAAVDLTDPGAFAANTWVFVAATRNGNTFRLFINGVIVASSVTAAGVLTAGTTGPWMGYTNANVGMRFDDFRYTVGVCRYTANFTPPTEAFPDTGP